MRAGAGPAATRRRGAAARREERDGGAPPAGAEPRTKPERAPGWPRRPEARTAPGARTGGTTFPNDPTTAHAHAFVARFGADGAPLRESAPVGSFVSEGVDAVAANASGVWAVGLMDNPAPPGSPTFFTDTDALVARWDPAGNLLWVKTLGTAGFEEAFGIALDAAGDGFVAGEILDGDFGGGTNTGAHGFVAKYDPLGNLQ